MVHTFTLYPTAVQLVAFCILPVEPGKAKIKVPWALTDRWMILELQRLLCNGRSCGLFPLERLWDPGTKAEHCGSTWWGQGGCLQPDSCLWCGLKYYFPQSAKDKVKRMSASAWLKHYVSPMLFLQMSTEMLHLQMSKMIEQCCTAC